MPYWFDEYVHLVTDPAHIALELTLILVFDGLIFGLIWTSLRKYIKNHHTKDVKKLIEAEHDYHEINQDSMQDLHERILHLENLMKQWQLYKDKK